MQAAAHFSYIVIALVALLAQLAPPRTQPWCIRTPGHLLGNLAALILHIRVLWTTIQTLAPLLTAWWAGDGDTSGFELHARDEPSAAAFGAPEANSRAPRAFDFAALETGENYGTLKYKPDENGHSNEPELYQAIGPGGSEVATAGQPALYALMEPATTADMNRRSFLAYETAVSSPIVQRDASGGERVMDETTWSE